MTDRQARYQEYLRSEHWAQLRNEAFRVYGYKCHHCDCKKRLQVHHHTYRDPWESCTVADVYPVCPPCHRKEHGLDEPKAPRPVRVYKRRKPSRKRAATGNYKNGVWVITPDFYNTPAEREAARRRKKHGNPPGTRSRRVADQREWLRRNGYDTAGLRPKSIKRLARAAGCR